MKSTIHDRISEIVEHFGNGKNTVIASKLGVSEGNIRGYVKNVMPKHDFWKNREMFRYRFNLASYRYWNYA